MSNALLNKETLNNISTSGGNIGIGTDTPTAKLEIINTTSNDAISITQSGSGNSFIVKDDLADTTPFVIDSAGNITVGSTTRDITGIINGVFQLQGITGTAGTIGQYSWNVGTSSHPYHTFNKSLGATVGTRGAVADGQVLGITYWAGDDGTNFIRAASMTASVDGTPGTNDMPGRLTFSTTPDGSSTPIERMRIDSSGRVGIGTVSPGAQLNVVSNTTTDSVRITQTGTGNALVVEDSANPDTTPFVIDSAGKVVIGHTAAISSIGVIPTNQTIGTGISNSTVLAACFANDAASSAILNLNKSRGALGTIGTIVQTGDILGSVRFAGDDSAALIRGAEIRAEVDATPGINDMPGRLMFLTTADGASSPGERMRIDNVGNVGIANSTPQVRLTVDRLLNSTQPASYTSGTTATFLGSGSASSPSYVSIISGNTGVGGLFFGDTDADSRGRVQYDHTTDALTVWSAGTSRFTVDSSGNCVVTGVGGLGYGTGSGGAVTQLTSRTTGVTLNKTNGAITLFSAAGSATWQSFTVTNSTVAATDTIVLSQKSGTDLYQLFVTAVAAGSFRISFATTGGTTVEQPVFNFAVIKAVTA